jgi:hypothetical protein
MSMAGRQWHWVAAGVAALAVFGAVLMNDPTPGATITAQTFPTVANYQPDNGGLVVATPTMDATTVTKSTSVSTPAPPPKPTSPSPPAPPPPSVHTPSVPPRLTISLSLPDVPVYYPNCDFAWAVGAAPIDEDEPGYREDLDGDHDGIACEHRH